MSIGKTRGFLYWLNRLLGDIRLIMLILITGVNNRVLLRLIIQCCKK